jgi:hypothetical protein
MLQTNGAKPNANCRVRRCDGAGAWRRAETAQCPGFRSGFGPGAGVGPGAWGGELGVGELGYGSGVGEPTVGERVRGAGPVL